MRSYFIILLFVLVSLFSPLPYFSHCHFPSLSVPTFPACSSCSFKFLPVLIPSVPPALGVPGCYRLSGLILHVSPVPLLLPNPACPARSSCSLPFLGVHVVPACYCLSGLILFLLFLLLRSDPACSLSFPGCSRIFLSVPEGSCLSVLILHIPPVPAYSSMLRLLLSVLI
jgi:hypothetical protein